MKTTVSIWRENMLGYLSLDIICSSKPTDCSLLGTDNVCEQISQHIFGPNGGYYLLDIFTLS